MFKKNYSKQKNMLLFWHILSNFIKIVFFTCAGQIKLSRIKIHNVGDFVAKIIEPPILMSRIMMLVLATSLVVLAVLGYTLVKMVPLERPEVFFLLTHTPSVNTVIEPLDIDSTNDQAFEDYEQGFVREYIIMRNTLYTNANITNKNWATVKNWSSDKVFAALKKTKLYKEYMLNDSSLTTSCRVNFIGREPLIKTSSNPSYDEYIASFAWACKNIGGQANEKSYKIRLRIRSVLDKKMPDMLENLKKLQNNPLGIQVFDYTVLDGDSDPLNSDGYFL